MSDETYNGWKNYPTWCVNLWLSNDEGLYGATIDQRWLDYCAALVKLTDEYLRQVDDNA